MPSKTKASFEWVQATRQGYNKYHFNRFFSFGAFEFQVTLKTDHDGNPDTTILVTKGSNLLYRMDELRLHIYYQHKGKKLGKRYHLLYFASEDDLEDYFYNSHDNDQFYELFKGSNRAIRGKYIY